MVAALKLRPSCALAAVPPAPSIARPRTSSRRLKDPFSKRDTRFEMIASMSSSLVVSSAVRASRSKPRHEVAPAHLFSSRWLVRASSDLAGNETDAIGGRRGSDGGIPSIPASTTSHLYEHGPKANFDDGEILQKGRH